MMTEKEFLKEMKENILDTETNIDLNTNLRDVEEWDSLSVVDFIARANVVLGKAIERDKVMKAETFADLYDLIK